MSDLERLERLEQSITQLLYEIDSNFSKGHRIITTNILPVVEKYADNSAKVWEDSKFWKQFFEASANVSLSGYEEQAGQDGNDTSNTGHDDSDFLNANETHRTPRQADIYHSGAGQSPLDLTGDADSSTILEEARLQAVTPLNHRMESLEISSSPAEPQAPQTQGRHRSLRHRDSDTPASTPRFRSIIDGSDETATPKTAPRSRKNNPLLHRVLDSNWKIQATPHSTRSRYTRDANQSTSPNSSPPEPGTGLRSSLRNAQKTPSRGGGTYYDSDDESSIGQMSPPVTMAFSLPPSKLLRTPAKEAARYVVDEILRTAGAKDLSSVPSESPLELRDIPQTYHDDHSTILSNTQRSQNQSRRLFEPMLPGEETPIARKDGAGVLDNWQESHEGSNWL